MVPPKKSDTLENKKQSKRQTGESKAVYNTATRTRGLLKTLYKKGARQYDISPVVEDILKLASDSDDIEQIILDATYNNKEASSNLSSMSQQDKIAVLEDVNNILKKHKKDGSGRWMSGFMKKKLQQEKEQTTS